MFDVQAIKERHNLLTVIGADTGLNRVAGTNGGEWAGPCPFCGGTDRLRVQPNAQRWFCRQCTGSPEQNGWLDVIDYVGRRDNLSFRGVCEKLGGDLSHQRDKSCRPRQKLSQAKLKEPPSADWQAAAWRIIEDCEAVLWSDVGAKVRLWLNDKRGLADETIRRWRLGFNSQARELYGLWIPRGVTIPHYHKTTDTLWAVNVRRGQGKKPRYKQVKGGTWGLFGADTLQAHDIAVVTEGEFDAMLLEQHAGDLVAVITMGAAGIQDIDPWLPWLLSIRQLLIAQDNDAAGRKATRRWLQVTKRAREMRVPIEPPEGKDITDYWRADGDLREWVLEHLDQDKAPSVLERLEATWQQVCPGGPAEDDDGAVITFLALVKTYEDRGRMFAPQSWVPWPGRAATTALARCKGARSQNGLGYLQSK